MGNYWSSVPVQDPQIPFSHHHHHKGNNNKGDVIVIPVDQSKQAETAFEWYVHHVHKEDNVVRIVHCQELILSQSFLPDLKGISNKPASTIEDQLKNARDTGAALIEKYENKLSKYQINGSVHSEFAPSPGELILRSLDKYHGTSVVMGTRGFGMIRRTILGSVSQYVILHSHVPVTVIPPEVQHRFF